MYSIDYEELFLGKPYKLGDVCYIHQLTINEVYSEKLGSDKYHYYVNLLTMDKAAIQEGLKSKSVELPPDIGPFDYLMLSAQYNDDFFLELKNAFSTFTKEDVFISCKNGIVIVGNPKERRTITKENFEEFANILRAQNRLKVKEPPPENESPMARKFRLKREERERIKAKKQGGAAIQFADMLSAICASGIGITPFNIGELTIYQTKDLFGRITAKEQYHSELDMLMAGADSKKIKPKYWVRNLLKEE